MRLICPNCGAQYEVPDEVIPEPGRDVQCSNCGDTWFQYHPDHEPASAEAAEAETDWQETRPEPEPEFEQERASEKESAPEPEITAEPEEDEDVSEELPMPEPEPERRELDSSVAEVLRQEAAYEEQARQAEMGGGLETQPDLGLDESDRDARQRSEQARARMARLRGEPEEAADADLNEDIDPASRRNLLPDIEEINSSLDADSAAEHAAAMEREADVSEGARPRKSAFRSGFRLAVVLAVLGLILYIFAPRLAAAVPALEAPLTAYVEMINSGRTALSNMLNDLAGSLTEETGS